MTCLDWTIYSWKGFYLIGCPLLLRTNYRCVESLNISVDVAKCLENVHKFNKSARSVSMSISQRSVQAKKLMTSTRLPVVIVYVRQSIIWQGTWWFNCIVAHVFLCPQTPPDLVPSPTQASPVDTSTKNVWKIFTNGVIPVHSLFVRY